MNRLRQLDSSVVAWLQGAVRRLQSEFGVSSWSVLAVVSLYFTLDHAREAFSFWLPILRTTKDLEHMFTTEVFFASWCVLMGSLVVKACLWSRRHEADTLPSWLLFARECHPRWLRLSVLCPTAALMPILFPTSQSWADVSMHIRMTCYLAIVYLFQIDPVPPGRSRLRNWLASWGASGVLIPQAVSR
jgi:hypothetical protein